MRYSYIAVLTNDSYYPGLCALVHSLNNVCAKYPLSVVVPKRMPLQTKQLISQTGVQIIEMDDIALDQELLAKNPLKRWNDTLFKLNIFNLTQFDKVVFLDLDMIVVKNIDELFDAPHMSSVAAGKCLHSDWVRLNSGLMVIEPNKEVYDNILSCCTAACEDRLQKGEGFGDQDVINFFYHDWSSRSELSLSEKYNCMSICIKKLSSLYGFDELKVLHFIDRFKPWQYKWTNYRIYVYLARWILHGEWLRIQAFFTYRKYLKESCPNYLHFYK